MKSTTDRRLLIISEIGCGPPHLGNRARFRTLLGELRQMGLQLHIADVGMSEEEKRGTRPFVDRWVTSFGSRPKRSSPKISIMRLPSRIIAKASHRLASLSLDPSIDQRMKPHWLQQTRQIQKKYKYTRVLVSYAFHSAFLTAFGKNCLKLLDTHDKFAGRNEHLISRGIDNLWFSTTMAGERKALLRSDVVIAIQEDEREYFYELMSGKRVVKTVGHFVDTPNNVFNLDTSKTILGPHFGFLASDNPLNIDGFNWFIEKVFPIVIAALPNARVIVAGRICKALQPQANVEVLGEIESVSDFYARVPFTINPMRVGTGLKIKTVESLAYGRPVVCTSVAAAGIVSELSKSIIIADSETAFAEAILRWCGRPEITTGLGNATLSAIQRANKAARSELQSALKLDDS